MIKWKQRIYALFLRQALGPLLDARSRQILHESIELSFSEGTFALSNVGLCNSYLNDKLQLNKEGLKITKASIESFSIQLSLVEGKLASNSEQASLTWRAFNLGSAVSLVAHVEIGGVDLELQPCPKETTGDVLGRQSESYDNTTDPEAPAKSVLSSYIEAALGSLRLSVSAKNMSVRFSNQDRQGRKYWLDLRLPSLSYQDTDGSSPEHLAVPITQERQAQMHPRTIFEKTLLFQGINISAGEASNDGVGESFTIALAEGKGKISILAIDTTSSTDTSMGSCEKRVHQDIGIAFNQQVKISVSEASLLVVLAVAKGFGSTKDSGSCSDSISGGSFTTFPSNEPTLHSVDEMDLYTMHGIMKQYEEARQLAEQNEMRGGILIPSNAFEEGNLAGEGDPRTFDVFFDANDKSFQQYASMIKESVQSPHDRKATSDMVHTTLQVHMAGGGIKMAFRGPAIDQHSFLGPEEYVLLTFTDGNVKSRFSKGGADVSMQVAHLEMDDARISFDAVDNNRVEIGNLLTIGGTASEEGENEDLLAQPNCISMHLTIEYSREDTILLGVEVNVKPVDFLYRATTISNLAAAAAKLRGPKLDGLVKDPSSREKRIVVRSALCSVSSIQVSVPIALEDNISDLFLRYGHYRYIEGCTLSRPALGFVVNSLTLEHKHNDNPADGIPSEEEASSTTLETDSFLFFASCPDNTSTTVRRGARVFDIGAAAGRLEVDPIIPIAIAYKRNVEKKNTCAARDTFPSVPAFSSFKARQDDDDDDDAIDRLLSENLRNVSVGSRRAMRAQDPQEKMLVEAEKCDAVVMIHVPEIWLDLSKEELLLVVALIKCVLPGQDGSRRADSSSSSPSPMPPIAVSFACDSCTVSMPSEIRVEQTSYSSQLLRLDKIRLYAVLGGSSGNVYRLLSHEMTFYETNEAFARKAATSNPCSVQERAAQVKNRVMMTGSESAMPIFYRSKLFPAISHTSPSALLDIICNEGEESFFVSLYHMTYRHNPVSLWFEKLRKYVEFESQGNHRDGVSDLDKSRDVHSLTRVFVSLVDCNFDYTSPNHFTTASRSILRVSDIRFSSNIVKPAGLGQAYNLSVGDISWLICNARPSHNFENSLLPGGYNLLTPKDLCFVTQETKAATTDAVFRDMYLKTILTLESIDAIFVKSELTQLEKSERSSSKEPRSTVSLTLGEISLYACQDSFRCFSNTLCELQIMMTALTDEQINKMRSGDTLIHKRAKQSGEYSKAISRPDVATIPVDTEDDFLLDGYDWTTVDHQCRASNIPPGEEQSARWFYSSPTTDDGINNVASIKDQSCPAPTPQIITQHFPIQIVNEPFEDGGFDEMSKLAGTDIVVIDTRILLHDMKVKIRLFDGYDWPEAQGNKKPPKGLFVISEQEICDSSKTESKAEDRKLEKSTLMGSLLAGANDKNSTFSDLPPLPEDRVRCTLAQNDLCRLARKASTYIQFSATGISLRLDSFEDSTCHQLKSVMRLSAKDYFLAETVSATSPVKMFGEWLNEVEHPRDSREGLLMLKMITWKPSLAVTPENELVGDECEVAMTIAPMRCILDQRAINFATAFLKSKREDTMHNWAAHLHPLPEPSLRLFRVMPIKLKIDYSPQKVDTAALKNGSVVELINILPLDSMVLTLRPVDIENVVGFGAASGNLVSHWLGDICATQMHKFLTNARPFEPLTNIGAGVSDLFVLPLDAYRNGENISKAVRYSVSSLLGTVAHETLTSSSRFAAFVAGEMAKVTSYSQSSAVPSLVSLPSRPTTVPRHVGDTAGHALESLSRGLQAANYKVVIVPYREYRRSGPTGAVRSIIRGIPLALAGPVGGASEAISYTGPQSDTPRRSERRGSLSTGPPQGEYLDVVEAMLTPQPKN